MTLKLFQSVLALAISLALSAPAQTAQTVAANMVPVAHEPFTITSIATLDGKPYTPVLEFGLGDNSVWGGAGSAATWGPVFSPGTLPLYVSYTNFGLLGGMNPYATGVTGIVAQLDAQQTSVAYVITYVPDGGTVQTVTIAALATVTTPPVGITVVVTNLQLTLGMPGWTNQSWFTITLNGKTWKCTYQASSTTDPGVYTASCLSPPPASP